MDSIIHHEERAAKLRAEAKEQAEQAEQVAQQHNAFQAERERVARNADADALEARVGLIRENETREMLMDRIRKMRELDKKPEPVQELYCPPTIRAQIELEQQAGREAVARAEVEQERMRQAREAEPSGQAFTVPVHHPNPSQDEQYPAVKATLGKPHDRPKAR